MKDALTTGDVAKICNVAPRTVSKWFDSGILPGYRIPGSKDRRIPLNQLIKFMKAHGMPLNGLNNIVQILVVDVDETYGVLQSVFETHGNYNLDIAQNLFECGQLLARATYQVVVLKMNLPGIDATQLCAQIKGCQDNIAKVIALYDADKTLPSQTSIPSGFDGILREPFTSSVLVSKIDAVLTF